MKIEELLSENRIVPVVVIKKLDEAEAMLGALCEGGINCAEITLRTACGMQAISFAAKQFPNMVIGAGTVVNAEQAVEAIASGAQFIVSPGISAEIADVCKNASIPYLPGCATPTEIMQALALGITTVKFFPANIYGGVAGIKALSGPFPQVKFVPTGGVDLSNLKEYFALSQVAAVGGSYMMKGDIRELCRKSKEVLEA